MMEVLPMITSGKLLRAALVGCVCTALFTIGAAAAPVGAGTVTADALRVRATPSAEGDIVATAPSGASVVVLEDKADGWYKVSYNAAEGYMSAEWLTVSAEAEAKLGYGKVNTDGGTLNLRATASTDGSILTSIPNGTGLTLEGISNGWYKVTYSGQTGYVSGDYIELTTELTETAVSSSEIGAQVVAIAKQYLGKPYVYGASGPNSFDCSGFTSYVYKQVGITLNRTATAQLDNGTSVSKDQLQPGDLVFFKRNTSKPVSHVGIYIGDGNFIHASTNEYEVRIDSLYGYYANIYVYGRHIA